MEIQLSSGQGPAECELAVGKLLRALMIEDPEIRVLDETRGKKADGFRSVRISCGDRWAKLEGTIQWICVSPYRPRHKRKNWFVDVSVIGETPASRGGEPVEAELVRFETFRSGGPGGQHVNKVETGVRAIYLPTGLSVVSTEARSQYLNKKLALDRLCRILAEQEEADRAAFRRYSRLEHYRLERGNPVRVYEGMEFRRIR